MRLGSIGWVAVLIVCGGAMAPAMEPVARAPWGAAMIHAHNDYEHRRPLMDALEAGARSVEADVHLVAGELLVAHDAKQVVAGRTLGAMYLEPLARRVAERGGSVYGDGRSMVLLIDFKGDAGATYGRLKEVLTPYAALLTRYDAEGRAEYGAITVVLTGNEPAREAVAAETGRVVALDGKAADVDAAEPVSATLVPLISGSWRSMFKWDGKGEPPAAEVARVREIVARTHAQGRTVRFWSAPDNAAFWAFLKREGVDWINTDQLAEAQAFLGKGEGRGTTRP